MKQLMNNSKRVALVLMSLLAASLLALPQLLAQTAPAIAVHITAPHYQAQFPALLERGFRRWDNGFLIAYEGPTTADRPAVVLYDKGGDVARQPLIWFDKARAVSVADAAISPSGQLVVAGGTASESGVIANFISEIGNDDHVHRVIRTTPFMPIYVCALDDGTVWSYGIDRDDHLNAVDKAPRLRRFSFAKGQIQAVLEISNSEPGWQLARGRYPGELSLRCNSKTVVLYNGGNGELVEFSLQTNRLSITQIETAPSAETFRFTGFALTESGDIFASFFDRSDKKSPLTGMVRLSRDGAMGLSRWVEIEGTVGPNLEAPVRNLLGVDGSDLVHTRLRDDKLLWSKQTAP